MTDEELINELTSFADWQDAVRGSPRHILTHAGMARSAIALISHLKQENDRLRSAVTEAKAYIDDIPKQPLYGFDVISAKLAAALTSQESPQCPSKT